MTTVERKTRETEILVTLKLEGSGQHQIDTGIGFLDQLVKAGKEANLNCFRSEY